MMRDWYRGRTLWEWCHCDGNANKHENNKFFVFFFICLLCLLSFEQTALSNIIENSKQTRLDKVTIKCKKHTTRFLSEPTPDSRVHNVQSDQILKLTDLSGVSAAQQICIAV